MARMSIEKRESLHFYKYLCQKIGSEKVVKTRRLICVISDIGQGEKMMTSGSKGEGLDLNGSDFDAMIIDPNFKVYQSESEVQDDCFAIPLIMNTEETQPCFTQLWSLNHNIQTIPNVLQKHHRGYVLSGELFKLCYKNFSDVKFPALYSGKIHGPCISDKNDTLDIAWQSLQRLKYVQWILSDCGTIIFEPESLNTIIFCGIGYQLIGETYIARHTFRVAAKLDKLNSTSAASRLFSLTS
ncbi:unnamed protein product [Mytilus edulis]|uniref:Uncharacterized protein n=1 Tax=Mytilus edulis TaxID=6550 RepID=A0A8S3SBM5_MYTED|nr:unnamed protein product [Mytilus edulis]